MGKVLLDALKQYQIEACTRVNDVALWEKTLECVHSMNRLALENGNLPLTPLLDTLFRLMGTLQNKWDPLQYSPLFDVCAELISNLSGPCGSLFSQNPCFPFLVLLTTNYSTKELLPTV
eukprot:Sdes_comp20006_c0_seq3m12680